MRTRAGFSPAQKILYNNAFSHAFMQILKFSQMHRLLFQKHLKIFKNIKNDIKTSFLCSCK